MGVDVNDVLLGRASCEVVPFRLPFWIESRLLVPIPPRPSFLGGKLLRRSDRMFISGATGVGKTLFAMGLAEAICTASNFMIYPAGIGGRVLYLDYEVGRETMQERASYLAVPRERLAIVCCDDAELGDDGLRSLDSDEGQQQLLAIVESYRPDVVIVDNLYSACAGSILGGGDRSGAGQAHEAVVPFLRDGLSRRNIASVLMHHTGNDRSRPYGDSRLTWQMTAHLHLERPDGAVGPELLVSCKKLRGDREHEPFLATWEAGVWTTCQPERQKTARPRRLTDAQRVVMQSLVLAIDQEGEPVPPGPGVPTIEARGVREDTWRHRYYAKRQLEDENSKRERDTRSKAFRDARDAIEAAGYAASANGWWWLVAQGTQT
ncbi:MAG: AAA family ATPase [Rhodospirillales bacterium]|nr:AAA family ATPase [Rhodospirillales bacterium]